MDIKHTKTDRNDPKLRAVVQEVGIVGYGVYWYFMEEMYEGRKLENGEILVNTFAFLFKITALEMISVINSLIKYGALINAGGELRTPDYHMVKEKYRKAGSSGANKRWKENIVPIEVEKIPEKPKQVKPEAQKEKVEPIEDKKKDSLEELIKAAVKNVPVKPKEEEKPKPKQPKNETLIAVIEDVDFKGLETMSVEVPKPLKEAEFLPLFNEIKKQYKPKSKGSLILSVTDKSNLKKLIAAGYTMQDFIIVINAALKTPYVQEQGLDTPNHVLRVDNFARYLSKSEKTETATSTNFISNR